MFGKSTSGRTLRPPVARPSSTLVSRASLCPYPSSHSLILGAYVDSGWLTGCGVGHDHHSRIQKGRGGTDIIADPSAHTYPAAADPHDRCRQTTPLLPSRQFSSLLVSTSPPLVLARPQLASRRAASALPRCRFPVVRRQVQHPPPTADPPVPSPPKNISQILPPPPYQESV
jgi:hypothetical protein